MTDSVRKPKAGEPSEEEIQEWYQQEADAMKKPGVYFLPGLLLVSRFGRRVWRECRERTLEEAANLCDPSPEPEGLPMDTGRMWRRAAAAGLAAAIRALAPRKET